MVKATRRRLISISKECLPIILQNEMLKGRRTTERGTGGIQIYEQPFFCVDSASGGPAESHHWKGGKIYEGIRLSFTVFDRVYLHKAI